MRVLASCLAGLFAIVASLGQPQQQMTSSSGARQRAAAQTREVAAANRPSERTQRAAPAHGAPSPSGQRVKFLQRPLSFEENRGQTAAEVKYLARGGGYSVYLTANEAVLGLRPPSAGGRRPHEEPFKDRRREAVAQPLTAVTAKLVGAAERPQIRAEAPLAGVSNYLIGRDESKWRRGVPNFARVRYEHVYPGIDLVYYGNQRALEFDFVVAAGADPGHVAMEFSGAERVELKDGEVRLHTADGVLRLKAPVVYQERAEKREQVRGEYKLLSENRIGFVLGEYDRGRELVIDPVLDYSTYLGGNAYDYGAGIAVDSSGNSYVYGDTDSPDFPTTAGVVREVMPECAPGPFYCTDLFVTKFDAAGAVVYSTFIGGNDYDYSVFQGIVVDAGGGVYLTGYTFSSDFPVSAGAAQTTKAEHADAFYTQLDANGAGIPYSTYFGGQDSEFTNAIARDASGNVVIAGGSYSVNLPLTDQFQTSTFGRMAKSTNAGGAWSAINTGLTHNGPEAIVVDPVTPSNVYIATYGGGVFKSTDGGANWTQKLFVAGRDLIMAAGNPSVLYVGTSGGGVYKSTDAGETWTQMNSGLGSLLIFALRGDPTNAQILYAGGASGTLYKSTDGAASWSPANAGLPTSTVESLAVDPLAPTTIYAGFRSGGAYKSTNGGASWSAANSGLSGQILVLAVDPQTAGVVYAGTSSSFNNLMKSTNGGGSWAPANSGIQQGPIRAIAITPSSPTTLYAGGHAGVFKSTNSGASWSLSSTGLNSRITYALAVDPTSPSTVYAGTVAFDGFLAKFSAAGARVQSSYLGGFAFDSIEDVLIDGSGSLVMVGYTNSTNFPLNAAAQSTLLGPQDGFVTRMAPAGTSLTFSTFLGGGSFETLYGATVDGSGNVWTTGYTCSTDLPITGAVQSTNGGGCDVLLAKYSNTGTRLYSSYFGGMDTDAAYGIGLGADGSVHIAGYTYSWDFPIANPVAVGDINPQEAYSDAFVAKFNAAGSALRFSSMLGGDYYDWGTALAIGPSDTIHLGGQTESFDFETRNAAQDTFGGGFVDSLVAQISQPAASVDLGLTATATPNPVLEGGTMTISGTVTNLSATTPATNVQLNGRTDLNFETFASSASQGFCNLATDQDCFLGTIAPGGTATFTIEGIPFDSGLMSGELFVRADENDSNATNNNVAFQTTVNDAADLATLAGAVQNPTPFGQNVVYQVAVGSIDPADALTGVGVTINIPAGTTLVGAVPSQGSCSGTVSISCSLGTLAAFSDGATVVVTVNPSAAGSYVLAGQATHSSLDPNAVNNAFIAEAQVLAGGTERIVLGDRGTGVVRHLDAGTLAQVGTNALSGVSPDSVAISPNGRIAYVANQNDVFISVVDLTIGEVVDRIPVSLVQHLALSPDGKTLVAPSFNTDIVYLVDTDSRQVTTLDLNGYADDDPELNNDIGLRAVTAMGGNGETPAVALISTGISQTRPMLAIDLESHVVARVDNTEVGTLPFSSVQSVAGTRRGVSATVRHKAIAVRQSPNTLFVIEPGEVGSVFATQFPLSSSPLTLAITPDIGDPDGVYGYVVVAGAVQVYDLRDSSGTYGQLLNTVSLPGMGSLTLDAGVSLDGSRLFVSSDSATSVVNFVVVDTALALSNPAVAVITQTRIGSRLRAMAVGLTTASAPAGAAVVSSVSPTSYTNSTAQTLTINGSNFRNGALVRVGSTLFDNASVLSPTQIQVPLPIHFNVGTHPVIVSNTDEAGGGIAREYESGRLGAALTVNHPATYLPRNAGFLSSIGEGTVSELDPATKVMTHVPVGTELFSVAYSAQTQRAYVQPIVPAAVQVYNPATNSVEATISLGSGASGQSRALAIRNHPVSGALVLYAVGGVQVSGIVQERLSVIDLASNTVIGTITTNLPSPGGSRQSLAASLNGRYVYHLTGSQGLVIFDVQAGTSTAISTASLGLTAGFYPEMHVTPDGNYLYLGDYTNGVRFFDIVSNPLSPTLVATVAPGAGQQFEVVRVAGGRLVVYDLFARTLHIFSYDATPTINFLGSYQFTEAFAGSTLYFSFLDVLADGRFAYVMEREAQRMWVIDLDAAIAGAADAVVTSFEVPAGVVQFAFSDRPRANVAVSGPATTGTLEDGEQTTLSYTLVNLGPDGATGVVLRFALPAQLGFVSGTVSTGGTCSLVGTVVECTVGNVPFTAFTATVDLTVVATAPGSGSAELSAFGTEPDGDVTDNRITVATTVTAVADLALSSTALPTSPSGTQASYTVHVDNLGPSDATSVMLEGSMTGSATFASVSSAQGSCNSSSTAFACTIGTIAGGQQVDVTVVTNVSLEGWSHNQMTVSALENDPNPINNSLKVQPVLDQPPVADAGADRVVAGASAAGGSVTLNGGGSRDPEGTALTYTWRGPFPEGGGQVSGATPTVTLPFGVSDVTLTVSDGRSTASDQVRVTVSGFELQPPTETMTVTRGRAYGSARVAATHAQYDRPVSLSCAGAPRGASCYVTPNAVTPGASAVSAQVVFSTTSGSRGNRIAVAPGTYTVTLRAASGTLVQERALTVVVPAVSSTPPSGGRRTGGSRTTSSRTRTNY